MTDKTLNQLAADLEVARNLITALSGTVSDPIIEVHLREICGKMAMVGKLILDQSGEVQS